MVELSPQYDPSIIKARIKDFELNKTSDGEKIRQQFEAEFGHRISVLNRAIEECGVSPDSLVLHQPVLERSDLGYPCGLFLFSLNLDDETIDKLTAEMEVSGITAHIHNISQEEIRGLQTECPEAWQYLDSQRGKIPQAESLDATEEYNEIATDLEVQTRILLSQEQKEELKEIREQIAELFVSDMKKRFPVLASHFSGSTFSNIERFGASSDLDIDLFIDDLPEGNLITPLSYASYYLIPKYAEDFQVKVDLMITFSRNAQVRCYYNPKLVNDYKERFGIDVEPKAEVSGSIK